MNDKVHTAKVKLREEIVGAVTWLSDKQYALFEYDPMFKKYGLDISPIHMSINDTSNSIYSFQNLNKDTYLGLPGLLSDSLPDKYGNSIIDTWLIRNGREVSSFSPVERLCYTGKRGMGALEFKPQISNSFDKAIPIEIENILKLSQDIIMERSKLNVDLHGSSSDKLDALNEILRVGTSAGGARAKAIIAINDKNNIISSGHDV